jgi:hypothetical protein
MWANGQMDNSKNVVSVADFPADNGDLLQAPTSIRFVHRLQDLSAKLKTHLRQKA